MILFAQGVLMLGVVFAPALIGYRFFFPRDFLDWSGMLILLFGTALVIVSVYALKAAFTIQAGVRPETKLVTRFPFNYSRNPMYVGGLLMCLSWSLLQRSWIAAILTIALAVVLKFKIKIEEQNLEKFFGDSYSSYKAKVRRYF